MDTVYEASRSHKRSELNVNPCNRMIRWQNGRIGDCAHTFCSKLLAHCDSALVHQSPVESDDEMMSWLSIVQQFAGNVRRGSIDSTALH